MSKFLEISFKDESSSFKLTKLDRKRLYGWKRRIPVDSQGRECQTAALTRDGQHIMQNGSTASLYVDANMDVVERDQIQGVDSIGNVVECRKSTLDTPQTDIARVTAIEFLNYAITHVYCLDPISISPGLDDSLSSGDIYRMPFQYKESYISRDSFLLKNDGGYFLLIGEWNDFEYLGCDEVDASLPDEESDFFYDNLDMVML